MEILDLGNPQSLPSRYLRQLSGRHALFESELFFDGLKTDPAFVQLVQDIDRFCVQNRVIGIHYTHGFPEDFRQHGLLVRSGEQIRSEFMSRFGKRFTAAEREAMQQAWNRHFTMNQRNERDGRISFNFTTDALGNGGAESLLTYYGGEQVYKPIYNLPGIGEKLRSIGQPLLVHCELVPAELHAFIQHPWGSIVASSYHRLVNPHAYQQDQDGWQCVPLPPERIREVVLYSP